MTNITTAYIGLGSNLGDRRGFINKALEMLRKTAGVEVAALSDLVETSPLAQMDQPKYINSVAQIKTSLTAGDLHKKLLDIENALGKTRQATRLGAKPREWSPRTIDLDILLFGSQVINKPDLTVPHPQLHLRSFVLEGLYRLDPQLIHPVLNESMAELAGRLNGSDFVLNHDVPQLISIAGIIGVGKTTLAEKLSQIFGSEIILEPYDTNPFLPAVYAGNKSLALDSQLYFLTNRLKQLSPDNLEKGRIVISDYIFSKEMIYAKRLLDAQQFSLYEEIYSRLYDKVVLPVLVIYLRDSAEKCLDRIHQRKRPYEQRIRTDFLNSLDADHQQLFNHWKTCPVIKLSTSKFDCMKEADVNHLVKQIKNYIAEL
jgi:2-amino-4-hydroxy-6-hydroxymethyldihydropteridine diphosphokinase